MFNKLVCNNFSSVSLDREDFNPFGVNVGKNEYVSVVIACRFERTNKISRHDILGKSGDDRTSKSVLNWMSFSVLIVLTFLNILLDILKHCRPVFHGNSMSSTFPTHVQCKECHGCCEGCQSVTQQE